MLKHYDIAKNEYETEDDAGRHRLVYAYFGLAIYFGQCLEETFSLMLWTDRIFKEKAKSNKEVNIIIDNIESSKKTMGIFIKEIKQCYKLESIIVNRLEKILEVRNYLTHKYFKQNIVKFHSVVGHHEMIKYFCDFIDETKQIDEQLQDYYQDYLNKLGLTKEQITELMIEMQEQEIKRATNI